VYRRATGHLAPRQDAVWTDPADGVEVPIGQHMANLRRKGAKNGLGKDPKRAEQRAAQLAAIDPDWDCPWPLDWQRHDRLLSGLVADEPDGVLPVHRTWRTHGRRRHRQVAPTSESAGRLGVAPALARRAWTGHGRRPQALTVWGTSGWLTGEVVPDDDKRTAELLAGCGGQKVPVVAPGEALASVAPAVVRWGR
jgi:hypothetical protein